MPWLRLKRISNWSWDVRGATGTECNRNLTANFFGRNLVQIRRPGERSAETCVPGRSIGFERQVKLLVECAR